MSWAPIPSSDAPHWTSGALATLVPPSAADAGGLAARTIATSASGVSVPLTGAKRPTAEEACQSGRRGIPAGRERRGPASRAPRRPRHRGRGPRRRAGAVVPATGRARPARSRRDVRRARLLRARRARGRPGRRRAAGRRGARPRGALALGGSRAAAPGPRGRGRHRRELIRGGAEHRRQPAARSLPGPPLAHPLPAALPHPARTNLVQEQARDPVRHRLGGSARTRIPVLPSSTVSLLPPESPTTTGSPTA